MIREGPKQVGDTRLRLRELTERDADELYRWRMDPSSRVMFRDTRLASIETHRAYLSRYLSEESRDRWFVIEAEGKPIGAIALYAFSPDGAEAEWGRFVIAPESRGRGYGRQALSLLIGHAREIGVRTLRCEVLAGNSPAERLYRDLGFAEAGFEEVEGRRFLWMALDLASAPLTGC